MVFLTLAIFDPKQLNVLFVQINYAINLAEIVFVFSYILKQKFYSVQKL